MQTRIPLGAVDPDNPRLGEPIGIGERHLRTGLLRQDADPPEA